MRSGAIDRRQAVTAQGIEIGGTIRVFAHQGESEDQGGALEVGTVEGFDQQGVQAIVVRFLDGEGQRHLGLVSGYHSAAETNVEIDLRGVK